MPAASLETTLELWSTTLRQAKPRMRPLFAAPSVAASANAFLDGLLGAERRKTGWMRAEAAGDPRPLASAGHPGAQLLERRGSARCGARPRDRDARRT